MYFFIDDSGPFKIQETRSNQSFGLDCMAIVIANQKALDNFCSKYSALGKCKDVEEEQAQIMLKELSEDGVKAFIVATNCNAYSQAIVKDHCENYVASLGEATKDHPNELRASVLQHGKHLISMHPQTYVKTMLINLAIENALRGMLARASLFTKEDLSSFSLVCDHLAPASYPTIKYFIHLQLMSNSYSRPLYCDDLAKIPHLLANGYLDATKIIGNAEFRSDDEYLGIKTADCIANFFRRLLRGNLQLKELSEFKKILALPYAFDYLHFNKDEAFLETQLDDRQSRIIKELVSGNEI